MENVNVRTTPRVITVNCVKIFTMTNPGHQLKEMTLMLVKVSCDLVLLNKVVISFFEKKGEKTLLACTFFVNFTFFTPLFGCCINVRIVEPCIKNEIIVDLKY